MSLLKYVQSAIGIETTSTTLAPSFSGNNTAGNLLFALGWNFAGAARTMTIADSQLNSWVALPQITLSVGACVMQAYYSLNCKAGANTVTITASGSVSGLDLAIAEYSGVNALDQHAESTAAVGASLTSPSITTTGLDNIILYNGEYGSNALACSAPFTTRQNNGRMVFGDVLNTGPTTISGTTTGAGASTPNAPSIVAFMQVVSGGAGAPQLIFC